MVKSERVSRRKSLKKRAARRLGISVALLGWVNGELIFLPTGMSVPGTPKVPKPGAAPEAVKASTIPRKQWQPPPPRPNVVASRFGIFW